MKRVKYLIILVTLFLITGCTATFNLDITNDSINENITLYMNNQEYMNFSSDSNNKYVNMYYDDQNNHAEDYAKLPIEGVKYYDFKDNKDNTVSYLGEFDYRKYHRSTAPTMGFNKMHYSVSNGEMHISTSEGFTFLYNNLTSIELRVKSVYDLMYSNADQKIDDTLIWNINRENADTKTIEIHYNMKKKVKKEDVENNSNPEKEIIKKEVEPVEEKENNSVLVVLIGSISFIIVLTLAIIITKKKM